MFVLIWSTQPPLPRTLTSFLNLFDNKYKSLCAASDGGGSFGESPPPLETINKGAKRRTFLHTPPTRTSRCLPTTKLAGQSPEASQTLQLAGQSFPPSRPARGRWLRDSPPPRRRGPRTRTRPALRPQTPPPLAPSRLAGPSRQKEGSAGHGAAAHTQRGPAPPSSPAPRGLSPTCRCLCVCP